MDLLNPTVLQRSECPICTYYMYEPIRMCYNGHSFCDQCFGRVLSCPVCRAPKAESSRNIVAERIRARAYFPCRNAGEGCNIVDLGSAIGEHEAICKFSPIKCLLHVTDDCEWEGPVAGFLGHCQQTHYSCLFVSEEEPICCPNFTQALEMEIDSLRVIIQTYEGDVYKCVWHIDYGADLMHWSVYFVGPREETKYFMYKIHVENNNDPDEELIINGKCEHFSEEDAVFLENRSILTNYQILKNLCDGSTLMFTVTVWRTFEPEN